MLESLCLNVALPLAQATDAAEVVESVAWYQTGWFMFVCLLALLFFSGWAGSQLAKSLRMTEYQTRLAVIFMAILFSSLMVVRGATNPDNRAKGSFLGVKLGVDLRGGQNLIGSLNYDEFEGDEKVTAQDIIPMLLRRVDPAGVNEIMIRPLGDDKIEVTIPSVSAEEAQEIWNRLTKAGHLQFRIVADRRFAGDETIMDMASKLTQAGNPSKKVAETNSDGSESVRARWVGLAREDVDEQIEADALIPFKFVPGRQNLVRDGRTLEMVDMGIVPLGRDYKQYGREFAIWCRDNGIKAPQILMLEPESERTNVEGKHLNAVRADMDEYGRSCVSFDMSDEGGSRMGYFTQLNKPSNAGERQLGIVLDNHLHSAPSIEEPIYDRGRITGNFTQEEIQDLIISLRSGKLDVALNKNPISATYIESALGEELKQKGLWAIGISLILVLVFMVFYYRFSGIVATLALVLNLLLILAFIMAIRQSVSLAGLAGLVLTVGMSVDANVLIFERIREELDRGSALRMAIRNGFDKATTTIVDANVTTLITALVLYVIGTEQIKGFAVTLILGILMSMFTAIYCSRVVFDIAERKRWISELNMRRILSRNKFDFLSKRAIAAVVSVVLIAVGVVCMWSLGSKILNHDLRGGSTARMVFDQPQDVEAVRETLNQQDLVVNDEKIEFSVSKLRDDTFPDRVFKVDTNLPTWDGPGEAPYDELSVILENVFEGKLSMMHVDVSEIASTSDNQSGQIKRKLPISISAIALTSPHLLLQDEGVATQDPAISEANQDNGQEPDAQESTESSNVAPQDSESESGGGDFEAGQIEKALDNRQRTSVKLTFKHAITGKAIKTFLSEAAYLQDFTLEEEMIEVNSPEVGDDDNPNSVLSKNGPPPWIWHAKTMLKKL